VQKRKEQNRLAQRAFRERKESYIQSLLKQIDEINAQYMRLIESYQAAKNNILCLQMQMEDLQKKLDVWNNTKLLVLKVGDRSNLNNTQVALCSMAASDVLQEAERQSGSSSSSLVLL
jgi:predicted nuclease with TOPRIM domain